MRWLRLLGRVLVPVFILASPLVFATSALAQESPSDGPVYIVQSGDTLFSIALRFGVTIDDLISANDLADPNNLGVGTSLTIPGLEGVQGVLTTEEVFYGESLRSLSRRHRIPLPLLARLNRIVSPGEIFVGSQVILPLDQEEPGLEGRAELEVGETLLELAVLKSMNPWTLSRINALEESSAALPGDVLFTPDEGSPGPGALPEVIDSVEFADLPLIQGESTTILIRSKSPVSVVGSLQAFDLRNGNPIASDVQFFQMDGGLYAGLQGIHAMTAPGFYPLEISISDAEGNITRFSQNIYIADGAYYYDPTLSVDPKTLDPAATGPEDELWNGLGRQVSPDKMWNGLFESPAMFPDCWTSLYGSRRSYNEGPYDYFHTGLDFCGGVGLEVKAPAPGRVSFAGPLIVRGNAIMIDHGWGVNTGYMHLSEILVEEGDTVEAGQVIGLVGGTGRVTGAHLHWEVWVGGFQVNPVTWLENQFPQGSPSAESVSS